jgi:hypothetical protein
MFEIRCPVCRADNASGPTCRRCKADLSFLWQLEEHRNWRLAEAALALLRGEAAEAARLTGEAQELRRGADARQFLGLACLLGGDYLGAWAICQELGLLAEDPSSAPPCEDRR